MNNIWAIILAAGESKRMGTPKMILPFGGKSIIENVIENVISSNIDNIIIVLGSNKEKVLKLTEKYPVMHCFNGNYKEGMLSSVKCGFENLPRDFRAALVLLGDQPMIRSSVIDLVIKTYNNFGKGLVLPVYNNKKGHPLLIDKKYRNEIMKLDGGEGLKELLKNHPDDLYEAGTEDPSILRDIDTTEDYNKELHQII